MASANPHVPVAASSSKRATASNKQPRPSELDRLEFAVQALIDRQNALGVENGELRSELEAHEKTLNGLEERLLAETQRRQDAVKRIDELVGLIEQLDPQR
jgi:DNA repair exonuclease SbcCD ATPase subunit